MGTNECSRPASKSSWDSQDFGDVNMVLKRPIFTSPPSHNELREHLVEIGAVENTCWHKAEGLKTFAGDADKWRQWPLY